MSEELLSRKQVAKLIGCHEDHIGRVLAARDFPAPYARMANGGFRWRLEQVSPWIELRREQMTLEARRAALVRLARNTWGIPA